MLTKYPSGTLVEPYNWEAGNLFREAVNFMYGDLGDEDSDEDSDEDLEVGVIIHFRDQDYPDVYTDIGKTRAEFLEAFYKVFIHDPDPSGLLVIGDIITRWEDVLYIEIVED